jgi:hypothetical protein
MLATLAIVGGNKVVIMFRKLFVKNNCPLGFDLAKVFLVSVAHFEKNRWKQSLGKSFGFQIGSYDIIAAFVRLCTRI